MGPGLHQANSAEMPGAVGAGHAWTLEQLPLTTSDLGHDIINYHISSWILGRTQNCLKQNPRKEPKWNLNASQMGFNTALVQSIQGPGLSLGARAATL